MVLRTLQEVGLPRTLQHMHLGPAEKQGAMELSHSGPAENQSGGHNCGAKVARVGQHGKLTNPVQNKKGPPFLSKSITV